MRRELLDERLVEFLRLDRHGLELVRGGLERVGEERYGDGLGRRAELLHQRARAAKRARAGIGLVLALVGELSLELLDHSVLQTNQVASREGCSPGGGHRVAVLRCRRGEEGREVKSWHPSRGRAGGPVDECASR